MKKLTKDSKNNQTQFLHKHKQLVQAIGTMYLKQATLDHLKNLFTIKNPSKLIPKTELKKILLKKLDKRSYQEELEVSMVLKKFLKLWMTMIQRH